MKRAAPARSKGQREDAGAKGAGWSVPERPDRSSSQDEVALGIQRKWQEIADDRGPRERQLATLDDEHTRKHLVQVYGATGSSVGLAAVTTTVAVTTGLATIVSPMVMVIGSGLGSFAAFWQFYKTDLTTDPKKRQLLLGTGVALSGLSVTPLVGLAAAVNPMAIPMALGGTAAIMGGAAGAAMFMPRGSMLRFAPVLGGLGMGLFGVSIFAMGQWALTGAVSPMLTSVWTYGGLGLMTAFVAFDTHNVIERFRAGDEDFLLHSADFFQSFMGIFRRLLYIFIGRSDD